MVLLAAAVVGTAMAAIGGVVLGGATTWLTKGVQNGRRTVILVAAALPFAVLAWGGLVFGFQALINERFLHRDAGLGDAWECPLPNGYAVLMINVTDHGWVYNPKTQTTGDVFEKEDAPYGVRLLQVDSRYVIGGLDSKPEEEVGRKNQRVDSYFVIDTATDKRSDYANYEALRSATAEIGLQLHLEPIAKVYSRYRFTWFDAFTDFLAFVPPVVAAIILLRWIFRLRKTREHRQPSTLSDPEGSRT